MVSPALPFPRAVPDGREKTRLRQDPADGINLGKAVDRPTDKLKGSPTGLDGITLVTPGKAHRSGPTG